MLVTAFNFKLDYQIQIGTPIIGKFDGKYPSLVCATTGGKILLHCPHDSKDDNSNSEIKNNVRFLNFNRKITALASGCLPKQGKLSDKDYLFVGTSTNILAYDVDRNADVFFKDIQDGVHALTVGSFGSYQPLLIAGGNCSLYGFDVTGSEVFWTVTGDNVSALTICDINADGIAELVVGSDDFELRVFRDEELLDEITEADRILFLKPIKGNRFAYGLSNGSVGVYAQNKRLWRVKTKNQVTSLNVFDVNSDGIEEILIGWSNGTFHARWQENGEILFKDKLSSPIAGIIIADYRMDGKDDIILVCESGEVKAYLPADADTLATMNENKYTNMSSLEDHKAINDLQDKKQELINELRSIEKTLKLSKSSDTVLGGLQSDTNLSYIILPDLNNSCLSAKVEANNDAVIVNIVAIDSESSILENCEILAVTPLVQGKPVSIPFRPTKLNACSIRLQTHVAARGSMSQLHVFEKELKVPKFSTFLKLPDNMNSGGSRVILGDFAIVEPSSFVTFKTTETLLRLIDYINHSFILSSPHKSFSANLRIQFVNVCKLNKPDVPDNYRQSVVILASIDEDNATLLKVQIKCDFMDLTAELIQDMAKFLNITELSSELNFPSEFSVFEKVINAINEQNSSRVQLAADMADDSQLIKALIVRAEDSRLLADMRTMRRAYTELFSLNNQLISSYNNRTHNHESLINNLKEVNVMIQKSANLRVGKAKSTVISDCRAAVKNNDMDSIIRIMRQGYDNRTVADKDKRK